MKILSVCVLFSCVIAPIFTADWSYSGENGPDNWGEDCNTGMSQSPIDIEGKKAEYDPDLKEAWNLTGWENENVMLNAVNNGHSVTVTVGNDMFVSGGGLPKGWDFKVAQFHFHWAETDSKGSEHTVDGKSYPLEVHFVTYRTLYPNISMAVDQLEGLAVLGFFFEIQDQDNGALENVVDVLEDVMYKDTELLEPVTSFPLNTLLGSDTTTFWRYPGSLTTPGCYESVTWTVFKKPIGVSADQMAKFRTLKQVTNGTVENDSDQGLIGLNYRPVQDLNGRTVKTSVKPAPPKCEGGNTGAATRTTTYFLTALLPLFVIRIFKL